MKMDGSNSLTLVYRENMDHKDVEGGEINFKHCITVIAIS